VTSCQWETEDLAEARSNARRRLILWQKRLLYSMGALLLSFACIYPFLAGHEYHALWESFGKYLIIPALALLMVFLYCTLLLWEAWGSVRDLE
jgi:hypothetical protein